MKEKSPDAVNEILKSDDASVISDNDIRGVTYVFCEYASPVYFIGNDGQGKLSRYCNDAG